MLLLDLVTEARLPDWPRQPAPWAHPLPAKKDGTRLTVRPDYPYARLAELVQVVSASKERWDGAPAAAAFRKVLLQPLEAERINETQIAQRFRSFVLLQESTSSRMISAGVLHQRATLTWTEPLDTGTIGLKCALQLEPSHLGSQIGADDEARLVVLQLAVSDVLRQLSFACKEVSIKEQRKVRLALTVASSEHVNAQLADTFKVAVQQESWRIEGWRSA